MTPSAILRLCSTCDPADFAGAQQRLQAALDAAGLNTEVREQACMNACAEPVSLALQGHGKATYLFAGLQLLSDQEDIVMTVRAYLQSPGGWIEDATQCGRLRHCLKGRVPTLSFGS